MATRRVAPLVLPAASSHTATVIFAHGLGDTGKGLSSAVEHLQRRRRLDEVKFILPTALTIPITANGGFAMPGWFDIKVLGTVDTMRANEDRSGILASADYFRSLVQTEIDAGIPSHRILLGGFSQGGAIALFTCLTSKVKLAGAAALSTWLVLSKTLRDELPTGVEGAVNGMGVNGNTPMVLFHGDQDPLVAPALNMLSYSILNTMGFNVKRNVYEGLTHSVSMEELDDLESFLVQCLPPVSGKESTGASAGGTGEAGKSEL